ncbi:hypothetical protein KC332_g5023 [Hortaea werneckii]|uniref:Pcc1-domain-containing protein n=1 Tax=Hortaea werneckii EXF-2000 TaxID=1157616 RepID=A0A1Z5TPD5_HORWE|nr:hypothetical protein KC358_g17429 [Hortaea werneckii]OTA37848.1 hypothetical protein BTJ68_01933 [Hortaea werneckii EXF-2000]KAI6794602.1 hypothetical protein KC350_g17161 [Hortaea werneckii]KAI6942422.1 hypothetical protein KC341_g2264 [Hortaea werneckii]KAI6947847.1 hypothetical protein KC348_g2277 [Hortaea werneckii]
MAEQEFPCTLTLHIPFPTHRLAQSALRTLQIDEELSPLVKRSFSLVAATPDSSIAIEHDPYRASLVTNAAPAEAIQNPSATIDDAGEKSSIINGSKSKEADDSARVLKVDYKASTNRMLRVAVNGFFESLGVVIQVMEELDVDVLQAKGLEGLEGVQGVEQGMVGSTA